MSILIKKGNSGQIESRRKLNEDEEKLAIELANKIKFDNSDDIINFGSETQYRGSSTAREFLKEVKQSEASDQANELLGHVVSSVKGFDTSQTGFDKIVEKIPVLNKIFDYKKKLQFKFNAVETNINDIKIKLETCRRSLLDDIGRAHSMLKENAEYIKESKINVYALKIKLTEYNETIIPEQQAICDETNDEIEFQKLYNIQQIRDDIIKKINSMETFIVTSGQRMNQLRVQMQGNNQLEIGIRDAITNLIPQWESHVASAIMLDRQKKTADMMNELYECSNEMMIQNAVTFNQNTTAISRLSEQSTIKTETLEKVQNEFITAIENIRKIKEESNIKRIEAQQKMDELDIQLHNKMIEMAQQQKDYAMKQNYTSKALGVGIKADK